MELSRLTALSPLDGRYWSKVKELSSFVSEFALIKFRVLVEVIEFFHFACTSEDINNLAYALMLKGAMKTVMLPVIDDLIEATIDMAFANASFSMRNFSNTWTVLKALYFARILFGGRFDMPNSKAGEVGSSTMPHKVNPIDFENGEGNLGLATAIFHHMSKKLPVSRLQRDLSDSTLLRNIGVVLGHSLLAYKSTLQGIAKLQVNEDFLIQDLDLKWELLGEAIQIVMKVYGLPEPYEKLKELTRGRAVTREIIREFIEGLDLPSVAKIRLLNLTPHTYVGAAPELAKNIGANLS